MLYVTGDLHGDMDRFRHPQIKKLKPGDVLAVCGDFGFVWDGGKGEEKILQKIGKRRHDTVFVTGCHDNYQLLESFPLVAYRGGTARKLSGNLYQLLRGETYDICGKKVFAFGGGDSGQPDSGYWWPEEQPSPEEQEKGIAAIKSCPQPVDLILTHEAPTRIKHFIRLEDTEESLIHRYLDSIAGLGKFRQWFFGCYHLDKPVPPRYRAVFKDVCPIE